MNREIHVRFCERLGVKLPWATRPVAESFFASLKKELVYRGRFRTREEAYRSLFEYMGLRKNLWVKGTRISC